MVGTSSLRRQAQLLHHRPDLKIVSLRGNVDTRLRKLDEGMYEAIVLAAAGLKRLGLAHRISHYLEPSVMLPAIGQGALGIETRRGDERVLAFLAGLHHPATAVAVAAERAFLTRMDGGCQVPLAAHCTLSDNSLLLTGMVADPNGGRFFLETQTGILEEAETAGDTLASRLLDQGGDRILAELYADRETD